MRLVAYDGCGPLLDGLRRATAARVDSYGLHDGEPLMDGALPKVAVPGGAAPAPADGRAAKAPEHTGTNTREPGVDEPDIVKTDGRRIVALAGGRLQVIDPATRRITHTLRLAQGRGRLPGGRSQLLLSGDRALVLTPRSPYVLYERPAPPSDLVPPDGGPGGRAQTELTLVDLSGAPRVVGRMTTESAYVDARQNGSVVRVVVRSTPRIAFPPYEQQAREKNLARNKEIVQKAPVDAWLPAFTVGEGKDRKTYRTPCDQVSRPASYTGTTMLTVLTFDLLGGLGDPSPVGIAANGETVYGTGSSLYVTGTPPAPFGQGSSGTDAEPGPERTDVHKFDVTAPGRPKYVASGSVSGHLLNQYAMSELSGNLRIATTAGPTFGPAPGTAPATTASPSQSAVRVLAREGARLNEVGQVGGLGKGERIYSVRFVGPLAYVVTFRQVDPLYVVDLNDPRRPRVTGELKISGYSAYLHPMADGRLLGIGQDADAAGRTRGLQASLFDVRGTPRRVAAYRLPGASSQAEFEPHAFTYVPGTGLVVVPVSSPLQGGGEALALRVTGTDIREVGRIRHLGKGYADSVQRSLVIGDTLWTFSEEGARATATTTLTDQAWLPFTPG